MRELPPASDLNTFSLRRSHARGFIPLVLRHNDVYTYVCVLWCGVARYFTVPTTTTTSTAAIRCVDSLEYWRLSNCFRLYNTWFERERCWYYITCDVTLLHFKT
ncbi:hypothetical protein TRVL_08664 [Trypanosoma vivax]|nr:hypothetical protein TRVL_08664 [Trypanosoma vivax]